MEILEHFLAVLFGALVLIAQDFGCIARRAGEEKQEVVFEIRERVRRHFQWLGDDAIVRQKLEASDSAKRRDVLILLADRLMKQIYFNAASLLGEFLWRDKISLQRVQCAKKRGGEAARRTESSAGRN